MVIAILKPRPRRTWSCLFGLILMVVSSTTLANDCNHYSNLISNVVKYTHAASEILENCYTDYQNNKGPNSKWCSRLRGNDETMTKFGYWKTRHDEEMGTGLIKGFMSGIKIGKCLNIDAQAYSTATKRYDVIFNKFRKIQP